MRSVEEDVDVEVILRVDRPSNGEHGVVVPRDRIQELDVLSTALGYRENELSVETRDARDQILRTSRLFDVFKGIKNI